MSLVNITVRLNNSYSYCQFEFQALATCLKNRLMDRFFIFCSNSRQVAGQALFSGTDLRQEDRTGFSDREQDI